MPIKKANNTVGLIGKKVMVKRCDEKNGFNGSLTIVDKVMISASEYYKTAIMNNASFEVYVGVSHILNTNNEDIIVLFKPTDIKTIY